MSMLRRSDGGFLLMTQMPALFDPFVLFRVIPCDGDDGGSYEPAESWLIMLLPQIIFVYIYNSLSKYYELNRCQGIINEGS